MVGLILAGAGAVSGCGAPARVKYDDSTYLIPRINDTTPESGTARDKFLVEQLDSDDAAVRFYAISALARMADNDIKSYKYYETPEARAPGVRAWKDWANSRNLASQPFPVTAPTEQVPATNRRIGEPF